MDTIILNSEGLKWEDVVCCLDGLPKIRLSEAARKKMIASRAVVEKIMGSEALHYGINTGFGKMATRKIEPDQWATLQENLIHSHAVGVGEPLPEKIARLTVVLHAASLAQGLSGVRPEVVEGLLALVNHGITPVIPAQGSVGASGDLAPLAHVALTLLGEGESFYRGRRQLTKAALEAEKLKPLKLEAKEGLSLVNGTESSLALACEALHRAGAIIQLADIAAAVSVEGDRASFHPFEERVVSAKKHAGNLATADNLRRMLAGSRINASHVGCGRVQDAYSFRCVPQVHGAAKETFRFVRGIVARELQSVGDNPLVFAESGDIVSGGNFHGEMLAMASDFLTIALAELGSLSERRVAVLTSPLAGEVPTQFLIENPGFNSGFMIPHVVMSALVMENRTLCMPASVDSIPTSGGQEDHVSQSFWAARKLGQVAGNVEKILAIELWAGCQAIDLVSQGLPAGKGVAAVYDYVRERMPRLTEDRQCRGQLDLMQQMVATKAPIKIAEEAVGVLQA